MKRWILAVVCSVLMLGSAGMMFTPTPVSAATFDEEKSCGAPLFLGLRPWYAGLCTGNVRGSSEIKQPTSDTETVAFIWTVILNVLYDAFLIVGYLALGFVIYGGFLYIMAQGDPAKAAKGQKTLTTAVIGTVVTMVATVLVNTAKVVIGINGNDWKQYEDGFSQEAITQIFNWIYAAAGIVAVAFIVKAGVEYVISRGDPGKVQKATRSIIYSVAGLLIVLLASLITQFVINAVSGAAQ